VDYVAVEAGVVNCGQSEWEGYLVKMRGVPPSPCFCHEYQNKGLTGVLYAKNIILKDL
jgi:hypothetical protein